MPLSRALTSDQASLVRKRICGKEDAAAAGLLADGDPVAGAKAGGVVLRQHLVVGVFQLDDVLDAPALEGVQEAGGDDDGFAGLQLAFDLRHDVRVELRGFGQQHHGGVGGEDGMQVDRNADHAEIIVQEILARGIERLVALDADRLAELAEKGVDLFERVARGAGHDRRRPAGGGPRLLEAGHLPIVEAGGQCLPGGALARDGGLEQCAPVEQHDLPRLGEHRVPELLGVAVDVVDAEGVDPAAAVAARLDVLEVAEDLVALVLLEELVGDVRVAGLRAGVDAVEDPRAPGQGRSQGPGNARTSWGT